MIGIFFCFLPLIFAFLLFGFGFKVKFGHELLAVLFGLFLILPVSLIQYLIPTFIFNFFSPVLNSLIKSIFLYGLIEELFKMIGIFFLPNKEYTAEKFLLLSFILGLSIGCFESVVYYFEHLQIANSKGAQLLYGQIALRIFSSDIIHMTCSGLCGLFIYSCKMKDFKKNFSFFVSAIILHGIYDFFAGFPSNVRWFSVIVILLAIIECRIKYTTLQSKS